MEYGKVSQFLICSLVRLVLIIKGKTLSRVITPLPFKLVFTVQTNS